MWMKAWIVAMVMAGVMCVVMVECQAQQPKVTHAQLTVKAGDLQHEIAAARTTTWIGYSEPAMHRVNSDWDQVVYLESVNSDEMRMQDETKPVPGGVRKDAEECD